MKKTLLLLLTSIASCAVAKPTTPTDAEVIAMVQDALKKCNITERVEITCDPREKRSQVRYINWYSPFQITIGTNNMPMDLLRAFAYLEIGHIARHKSTHTMAIKSINYLTRRHGQNADLLALLGISAAPGAIIGKIVYSKSQRPYSSAALGAITSGSCFFLLLLTYGYYLIETRFLRGNLPLDYPIFTPFATDPIMAKLARMHEFETDAFAMEQLIKDQDFDAISAFIRYLKNKPSHQESGLAWYYNSTHPTDSARAKNCINILNQRGIVIPGINA